MSDNMTNIVEIDEPTASKLKIIARIEDMSFEEAVNQYLEGSVDKAFSYYSESEDDALFPLDNHEDDEGERDEF